MKKVYLKESLYQEVLSTKKGTLDSNMVLELINGKKYQLIIAIKFIKEIADNEDVEDTTTLVGKIISKDVMIEKNYELFDDEIIAEDKLYKVEIGYLGTLIY
jgi:hypothetical protein